MRGHLRMTDAHRTTGAEVDVTPQSHVLVRGRRVPIHPVDAELLFGGSEHLNSQNIDLSRKGERTHVELVDPIRACNIPSGGEFAPVQPDVGTVVDTLEMQPDAPARVLARQLEL